MRYEHQVTDEGCTVEVYADDALVLRHAFGFKDEAQLFVNRLVADHDSHYRHDRRAFPREVVAA